ncbi:MAG TPA: GAF domain-containing protein [Burkholderiales bacterium]|nr:GAF domain-containing protein [Burkholderiales bacterium]
MLHTSRMNTLEMHASPDNPLVTTLRELGACPDLGSVIEILRRTVRSLIGADGVTVVLRDGASCHYIEEEAIGPLWKGQRFPMEACISGLAMMRGEQIAIADVYEDERVPHDAYRPTFVRALAMTPIATREVIGALGVYWATRHVATAEETYRLGAVSAAAATAIENLRLLEQATRIPAPGASG